MKIRSLLSRVFEVQNLDQKLHPLLACSPDDMLRFLLTKKVCAMRFRMFLDQRGFLFASMTTLLLCIPTFTSGGSLVPAEVQALKDIFSELGRPDWDAYLGPNICTSDAFVGVTCDCNFSNFSHSGRTESSSTNCHVFSLVLRGYGLRGTLPAELVRLPYLENLDLSQNYLSGPIPSEWGFMPNLVNISLYGKRLVGPIPERIGNISSVQILDLGINRLSGYLPPQMGYLLRLQTLILSSNNFTGELPPALANLTSLKEIQLSDNRFTGNIPDYIGRWTAIEKLVIQASGLQGPIPSTISALRNLNDFRISDLNGTEAHFPHIINSTNIQTLILRRCNLIGVLPSFLPASLNTLDVSFNRLSGISPYAFRNMTPPSHMYLTGNRLVGLVPPWITNSNLKDVDLSFNYFTAGDSGCQDGNANMFASSLNGNNSYQMLYRRIVPCLSSIKCPRSIYSVHINCGGGEVAIGSQKYNDDESTAGHSRFFMSRYFWAYSSTGHFLDTNRTTDTYALSNMSILSGEHPQLYMTARLSPLSLTYYAFCLANGNYIVSLHFAEIMFGDDIPGECVFDAYIQGIKILQEFNIKHEAGGVGKPIVKNFSITITDSTLNIQFDWAGRGIVHTRDQGVVYGPLISAISVTYDGMPSTESVHGAEMGIKGASFWILLAAVTFLVSLIIINIWLIACRGRRFRMSKDINALDWPTRPLTLRQIKAATNNFDAANKLGEGGFGPVYKGLLPDGTAIAVKQLYSRSKQGNREFLNEVGIISAIRHRNIVRIYGCCIEANQLLLVYEYMENNSLARALFEMKQLRPKLDWPSRQRICIGIAQGLAYLHEGSMLKIVHRDIKATNVLLDKDLNPKISDFGLSKLIVEDETTHTTVCAGTIGYIAPEYWMHGHLSDKADVYGFGIVALEIVSGRSNASFCRGNEPFPNITDWARDLKLSGDLLDVVDPRLGSDLVKDEALVMIEAALLCTNISPSDRPPMSSVAMMLEGRTAVVSSTSSNYNLMRAMKSDNSSSSGEDDDNEVLTEAWNTASEEEVTYFSAPSS